MMTIEEEARLILQQLDEGRWQWMKVKRFDPNVHEDIQQKYDALMRHHEQETGFLIELVRRLCSAVVARPRQTG